MTVRRWAEVDPEGLVVAVSIGADDPVDASGRSLVPLREALPDRPVGLGFRFHLETWQWVRAGSPALLRAGAAADAGRRRRELLAACDWTQGADSPLSAASKAAWAVYRQALRDITLQPDWPLTVVWPEPPGNAG